MCVCLIVTCESLSGTDLPWLLSHPSVRGFCIQCGMCDQCTRERKVNLALLRLQNPSLVFQQCLRAGIQYTIKYPNYILPQFNINNNAAHPLILHFVSLANFVVTGLF